MVLNLDWANIILTGVFGVVFGIIAGALYTVIRIALDHKRTKKEYKEGKVLGKQKEFPENTYPKEELEVKSEPKNLITKFKEVFKK